jgi:hypothetical protein
MMKISLKIKSLMASVSSPTVAAGLAVCEPHPPQKIRYRKTGTGGSATRIGGQWLWFSSSEAGISRSRRAM